MIWATDFLEARGNQASTQREWTPERSQLEGSTRYGISSYYPLWSRHALELERYNWYKSRDSGMRVEENYISSWVIVRLDNDSILDEHTSFKRFSSIEEAERERYQ